MSYYKQHQQSTEIDGDNLRKLFIGGLHPQTTRETVQEFYSQFGTVTGVTLMTDNVTKKSRCFAFVTFESEDDVDAAQNARPHIIDNKQVDSKRAMPKEDPSPELRVTSMKIFVGGMNRDVTEEQLQEYFSKYGEITECTLVKDKVTNVSKGFAFLTFNDSDIVDKIILHRPHNIDGSRADVKKGLTKEEMASIQPRQRSYGGGPSGDGYNYSGWDGGYGHQSSGWGGHSNGNYHRPNHYQYSAPSDQSGGYNTGPPNMYRPPTQSYVGRPRAPGAVANWRSSGPQRNPAPHGSYPAATGSVARVRGYTQPFQQGPNSTSYVRR